MDAFLRVDTHKEILTIIKEVCDKLEIQITLESEAIKEGGLKEIWRLLGKNSNQLQVILLAIAVILAIPDRELAKLQKENLKLDNKLKRKELSENDSIAAITANEFLEIEIDRVRKEDVPIDKSRDTLIRLKNSITNDVNGNRILANGVAISLIENDHKVKWHRSNFYKKLNGYKPIERVGTTTLDKNNIPVDDEKSVYKNRFKEFILPSDELEPMSDEEAIIDIISPVLSYGKYSWKGVYNGEVIQFKMKDDKFKLRVINKEVEFSNGSAIKCVILQKRKIGEDGLIKVTGTSVLEVLEVMTDRGVNITSAGIKRRKAKEKSKEQLNLFDSHR